MTKKIYEYALPISGGFDSIVSWLRMNKTWNIEDSKVLFYTVNYGQPYLEKEKRAVKEIEDFFGIRIERFDINLLKTTLGSIPTVGDDKIEGRNLMLLYIGAFYANKVILSAPDGDMHPWMTDKNEKFIQDTSEYFSYVLGRKIRILNPLKSKTKTGWAHWVQKEFGREHLEWLFLHTVSCYDPHQYACGKCKPCFRKWIQMVNTFMTDKLMERIFNCKIKDIPYSDTAIGMQEGYLKALRESSFVRYSTGRIEETFRALSLFNLKYMLR